MNGIDKDMVDGLIEPAKRLAMQFFQDEKIRRDFEAWQKERQSGERLPNG